MRKHGRLRKNLPRHGRRVRFDNGRYHYLNENV